MSFPVYIYTNSSPKNQLDKSLTLIASYSGVLRDASSVVDPIILIRPNTGHISPLITDGNYMSIPSFGRSYFITDIIAVNNVLFEIHAHCDVLSTYATAIRSNEAIIYRQEKDWNLYLDDGSFQVYNNPNILTRPFPSGFSTLEFILAVAGA